MGTVRTAAAHFCDWPKGTRAVGLGLWFLKLFCMYFPGGDPDQLEDCSCKAGVVTRGEKVWQGADVLKLGPKARLR